MDRSEALEKDEHATFDSSSDYSFNARNSVESVQKCTNNTQQPALGSGLSLNSGSRVCSYDTYEGCDDHESETTHHENVTYRTYKSYKDIHNTCDILEKFESSSGKSCECAFDAYSRCYSYCHANLKPVIMESAAGTVLNGCTAECSSSCTNSTCEVDENDTLKRKTKRQRIAKELMDTEATYQRHLELIIQVTFYFVSFCVS